MQIVEFALHVVLCCPNLCLSAFHHCHTGESCPRLTGTKSATLSDCSSHSTCKMLYQLILKWVSLTETVTIWIDHAGLNKSAEATSFTLDFSLRAVFAPVSCSRRFVARNNKSQLIQRRRSEQFALIYFLNSFILRNVLS